VHYQTLCLTICVALVASPLLAQEPAVPQAAGIPAPAAKGTLRIYTVPGTAQLFIDGARKGSSPASAEETFVIHLPEGEHQVKAVKNGFDPVERTIFVAADTDQTIKLDLAPGIEMIAIPAGCFMMGSPKEEPERDADEGPQHEVCLEPFEIGKYEVTFAQWDACVDDGGCTNRPDDEGWGRGDRPVINVSWEEAQDYIRWLNINTGEGYRLPTEAEWEYAARAGTTTAYSTGPCITTDQANYDGTFEYGDCHNQSDVDLHKTMPVGSYPPNPWGLYDVHGNINEFVQDCWNDGYDGAPTDGSAWEEGNCRRRVVRSGSWHGYPGYLRSAYRCRSGPSFGHRTLGFRLVRRPQGK